MFKDIMENIWKQVKYLNRDTKRSFENLYNF